MSSDEQRFDADKFLTERGWMRDIAGDADYDLACRIVRAVRNSDKGLILSGPCGVGKTSFVKAAFRFARCFTMPVSEWVLGKSQDAYDVTDESVILDDIGSEHEVYQDCIKVQPFADFVMRRYVDYTRILKQGFKPPRLIITTNLGIKDFDARYGTRIVSRLKEMCFAAKFSGCDKRKWESIS